MSLPITTLSLASVLIIVYIALSSYFLYVPNNVLLPLSLSWQTLWGIITYPFMHVGPGHLIANVAFLICVGFAAEKKLRSKDIISIFFLSSFTAGIVFLIIQPEAYLVGASAGIAGLFSAAFFSDLKRLLFGIVLFVAFLIAFTPLINKWVMQTYDNLLVEKQRAMEIIEQKHHAIEELGKEKESILENISAIEKKKEILGERYYVLKKQFEEQLNIIEGKIENVSREKKEWERLYEEKSLKYMYLEQGIQREKEARINHILHLVGGWIGIGYVIIFRRDLLWRRVYQVLSFTRLFKT